VGWWIYFFFLKLSSIGKRRSPHGTVGQDLFFLFFFFLFLGQWHLVLSAPLGTSWNNLVKEKLEAYVLNELQKENENNTHRRQRQLKGTCVWKLTQPPMPEMLRDAKAFWQC